MGLGKPYNLKFLFTFLCSTSVWLPGATTFQKFPPRKRRQPLPTRVVYMITRVTPLPRVAHQNLHGNYLTCPRHPLQLYSPADPPFRMRGLLQHYTTADLPLLIRYILQHYTPADLPLPRGQLQHCILAGLMLRSTLP